MITKKKKANALRRILTLLFIAALLAVGLSGCRETAAPQARGIEVVRVERRQAVIAWTTEDAVRGKVFYRPAAGPETPLTALETLSKSFRHQVILPNLMPGTRYTYWIGSPERRFQFQTQPEANTPFSFLLLSQGGKKEIGRMVMSEIPDFILDTGKVPGQTEDPYQQVRPYVPVFGVDRPQFEKNRVAGPVPPWALNWGELQLWVLNRQPGPSGLGLKPVTGLQGVLLPKRAAMEMPDIDNELDGTALHRAIVRHNNIHPGGKIAFVLVPAPAVRHQRIDGVAYLGLPMDSGDDRAVRIDVNAQSIHAVLLDTKEKIVLKEPPLKEKISCDDCRKLADQGAYDAAVAAYKTFITNNKGHFQIDDAYFAVALIHDEKRFDFPSALDWYKKLLKEEPASGLVPLARQRIRFLEARSDFDFQPLARFERIKKTRIPGTRSRPGELQKVLKEVEAVFDTFPNAVIAPQVLHWLGMQYKDLDMNRSVAVLERLSREYPTSPEAASVPMDIGDIYYSAGEYATARTAYTAALAHAEIHQPGLTKTLASQIKRCSRNILRVRLAGVFAAVLICAVLACLFLRPFGISGKTLRQGGIALVLLGGINFLAAWIIHEQFLSAGEMAALVAGFTAAAVLSGMGGTVLAGKVKHRIPGSTLTVLYGISAGLVTFGAGVYLTLFYINRHYLIVFNL